MSTSDDEIEESSAPLMEHLAELRTRLIRSVLALVVGIVLAFTVAEPILGKQAKVDALAQITARLGIAEADVIAVGDGANDLGMLGRAGLGVALHAKPTVAAQCDVRINFGDLTALLYVQGYAQTEFAG